MHARGTTRPFPVTRRVLCLAVAAVSLIAAGCGDSDDPSGDEVTSSSTTSSSTSSTTSTETPSEASVPVAVAFVRGEDVALARTDVEPPETARGALEALLAGPADLPAADDDLSTAVPEGTELLDLAVDGGLATVDLSAEFVSGGGSLSMQLRAAQVVFTLTQFDSVDRVTFLIDGGTVDGLGGEGIPATEVDRSDFTNVTPLILVTSPLPATEVASPLTVEGISNTFEATVLYELLGPDGAVLAEGFTTATAGSGTWGEFSVEVAWDGGADGTGTLVLFQENMESGGRQDVYEVAVELGS